MSTSTKDNLPKLYQDLADWWPLLSAPEDYAEEAAFYRQVILAASPTSPHTLLELGSGGGNNASHLKKYFQMTLVDISHGMLKVSRKLNPECEHVHDDMRTVRLERQFDAVFVHDAIVYMTNEADLLRVVQTAYYHCKPGGVALFAPDHTFENFKPSTSHGGHDFGDRGLRYLSWTWEPDLTGTSYRFFMVYVLRNGEDVEVVSDWHVCGLFKHDDWLRIIGEAGFYAKSAPFEHSELEPGSGTVFWGVKPLT